jgi:hypothetical protein
MCNRLAWGPDWQFDWQRLFFAHLTTRRMEMGKRATRQGRGLSERRRQVGGPTQIAGRRSQVCLCPDSARSASQAARGQLDARPRAASHFAKSDPKHLPRLLAGGGSPPIRPSTYDTDELDIHRISAQLGAAPLVRLSPAGIQDAYARLSAQGPSDYSVLQVHRTLHRALDRAFRWGLIPRNPASLVLPPRPRKREMKALTSGSSI